MNEYIKSDMYRYRGKCNLLTFLSLYRDRCFRWQVAYRLCNSKGLEKLLGEFLWKRNI